MTEQSIKEIAAALFWALSSHFDDDSVAASLHLMRDMLATRAVNDDAACSVLKAIITNARLA
jgi:hypothetical protein